MKKIFLILATIVIANSANSQSVASLRGGVTKNFSTGSPTFFGPGASFQYGLNENMALGANFDYHIGEASSSWINIEPRFDYYLNSAFNGFHVGSNVAYTMFTQSITFLGVTTSASASQMHIGASLGYTHPISDNLLVDVSSGIGYTMFTGSGSLGIRPAVSLGYKFGGK
jgi:hypothetical protein